MIYQVCALWALPIRRQFSASLAGSYAENEPRIYFKGRVGLKSNNIDVYLDFDNLWGGLLRELGIDPKKRKQKNYGLLPSEIEIVKELLTKYLSSFLYKHSDKSLYILSFENPLNNLYKEIPLTASKLIEDLLGKEKKKLQESIKDSFSNFKRLFLEKSSEETQKEGREVKTGLLFSKWLKEWRKQGYDFNSNEINHFLDLMQKEGLIRIEHDREVLP
ncbi:MAG: hypothetical protein ABGX12_00490 [Desulfurobacteriaceae bacterium]